MWYKHDIKYKELLDGLRNLECMSVQSDSIYIPPSITHISYKYVPNLDIIPAKLCCIFIDKKQ